MSTEENTKKENTNVEENVDATNDIMGLFEDPEYAYPLEDIISELKELGYSNPGSVVLCAMQDDILYVDSIEDNGTVYVALVDHDEDKGGE